MSFHPFFGRRYVQVVAVIFAVIVFLLWLQPSYVALPLSGRTSPTTRSLNLLIPATSSNAHLCRLLLSAAVLNYPPPVLINWGAKELKDETLSHLAKIPTILKHLDILYNEGKRDDLVLIVDGFDVHFQLPPEVIISRYFQEVARKQEQIDAQFGKEVALEHEFKNTVIFGPDKLCWPMTPKNPACWAVPDISDSGVKNAVGEDLKARFLNSGAIIGPVSDVRDIFRATLKLATNNRTTTSDQYYFGTVFGIQEYARGLLHPSEESVAFNESGKRIPYLRPGEKTEYHIGLDYDFEIFQTLTFFEEYIVWEAFDTPKPTLDYLWDSTKEKYKMGDWYESRVLPDDISQARSPFHAVLHSNKNVYRRNDDKDPKKPSIPTNLGWKDFQLGANSITGQIFPILHYTARKDDREELWKGFWFVPYAEELLIASAKLAPGPFTKKTIGGSTWWPGIGSEQKEYVDWGDKGGSFTSNGTFLKWEGICGAHEDEIFLRGKG